jgi:hypothetical protein
MIQYFEKMALSTPEPLNTDFTNAALDDFESVARIRGMGLSSIFVRVAFSTESTSKS